MPSTPPATPDATARPDEPSAGGAGEVRAPALPRSRWSRLPALLLLLATVGAFTFNQARRAAGTTYLSPDEATTIIAARAIVATGLPLTPSGRIYYRSPLSHYLDALSIAVLGDERLGWRAASVLAYALLLLLPGLALLRRGQPWLAAPWAALVGLFHPLVQAGYSARMYMVYALCATLSVLAAALWTPKRFDGRGVAYAAAAMAAALAHEHYAVVIPGLLALAALVWRETPGLSLRRLLRTPLVVAPAAAFAVALLLHFGDNGNLFPNAFANVASQTVSLGKAWSLRYPVEVLGSFLPVPPLLLLVVLLAWSVISRRSVRPSPAAARVVAVALVTYLLISFTLPFRIPHYVAPLFPLVCLALFALTLEEPEAAPRRSEALAWCSGALLVLFVGGMALFHDGTKAPGNPGWSWRDMRARPPPGPARSWDAVRTFARANHATLISSSPEIAMLQVGPVAAHVRSANVPAETPCSVVMDDFQPIPFAHHACQLEEIIQSAGSTPVLFVGDRLGWTIGPDATAFIRSRFEKAGVVDDQEVWCLGSGCEALGKALGSVAR